MSEQPDVDRNDPDSDPDNLSPRDDRDTGHEQRQDPDSDPEMMNPREG